MNEETNCNFKVLKVLSSSEITSLAIYCATLDKIEPPELRKNFKFVNPEIAFTVLL